MMRSWGNRVFQGLSALVSHNPKVPGPCFGGSQGAAFGNLVCKIKLCTGDSAIDSYTHVGGVPDLQTWAQIWRIVDNSNPSLRPFLALDREVVGGILTLEILRELDQICAVQSCTFRRQVFRP